VQGQPDSNNLRGKTKSQMQTKSAGFYLLDGLTDSCEIDSRKEGLNSDCDGQSYEDSSELWEKW
jgi:hypothetical protein